MAELEARIRAKLAEPDVIRLFCERAMIAPEELRNQIGIASAEVKSQEVHKEVGDYLPDSPDEALKFLNTKVMVRATHTIAYEKETQPYSYNIISRRVMKAAQSLIYPLKFKNKYYLFCAKSDAKGVVVLPILEYPRFSNFVKLMTEDVPVDVPEDIPVDAPESSSSEEEDCKE